MRAMYPDGIAILRPVNVKSSFPDCQSSSSSSTISTSLSLWRRRLRDLPANGITRGSDWLEKGLVVGGCWANSVCTFHLFVPYINRVHCTPYCVQKTSSTDFTSCVPDVRTFGVTCYCGEAGVPMVHYGVQCRIHRSVNGITLQGNGHPRN